MKVRPFPSVGTPVPAPATHGVPTSGLSSTKKNDKAIGIIFGVLLAIAVTFAVVYGVWYEDHDVRPTGAVAIGRAYAGDRAKNYAANCREFAKGIRAGTPIADLVKSLPEKLHGADRDAFVARAKDALEAIGVTPGKEPQDEVRENLAAFYDGLAKGAEQGVR